MNCQLCGAPIVLQPRPSRRFCSQRCAGLNRSRDWTERGLCHPAVTHGQSRSTKKVTEYKHRQIALHPVVHRARQLMYNAIRRGALVKGPCLDCGSASNIHGHHDDYLKPLEVTWLCRKCHQVRHQNRSVPFSSDPRYTDAPVAPKLRTGGRILSEETVAIIKRRLRAGGPRGLGRKLAKEFAVSPGTISLIRSGVVWAHVEAA